MWGTTACSLYILVGSFQWEVPEENTPSWDDRTSDLVTLYFSAQQF